MEVRDEDEHCPSDAVARHRAAASVAGCKRCTLSHSVNLPTVQCAARRSEFNTMANTLHYTPLLPAAACAAQMFLYPRASENFGDVSQKTPNGTSSSIRTMKSLGPIRGAPDRALANGVRAPPRVMLASRGVKTLRIACVRSYTAIAEH